MEVGKDRFQRVASLVASGKKQLGLLRRETADARQHCRGATFGQACQALEGGVVKNAIGGSSFPPTLDLDANRVQQSAPAGPASITPGVHATVQDSDQPAFGRGALQVRLQTFTAMKAVLGRVGPQDLGGISGRNGVQLVGQPDGRRHRVDAIRIAWINHPGAIDIEVGKPGTQR